MVVKKTEEPEITMESFDKEYVIIETAYDTYKLRRPKGPNVGRTHLRLTQKWAPKLQFDEVYIENRKKTLDQLIKSGLTMEESVKMLANCGLIEPADPGAVEKEQERQEKAQEEWFDKVLPEIIVGKTIDDIPSEDFGPIFMAMYNGMKFRPDYFRFV